MLHPNMMQIVSEKQTNKKKDKRVKKSLFLIIVEQFVFKRDFNHSINSMNLLMNQLFHKPIINNNREYLKDTFLNLFQFNYLNLASVGLTSDC